LVIILNLTITDIVDQDLTVVAVDVVSMPASRVDQWVSDLGE
jgi:hypothetical protein